MEELILSEIIETKIFVIRGQKVMMDYDLAGLYDVEVKQLKRSVRRNLKRFPEDFMFELTTEEHDSLRSQIGTLKRGEHSKYLPFAFTENGVAMLSGILNSYRAIAVNIQIMRTFTKIKRLITTNKEIELKLELVIKTLNEHDVQIDSIYSILDQLLVPPEENKRQIGFIRTENPKSQYVPKPNKISNHKSQKGIKDGN
jgi:hypothetical protein